MFTGLEIVGIFALVVHFTIGTILASIGWAIRGKKYNARQYITALLALFFAWEILALYDLYDLHKKELNRQSHKYPANKPAND